jgi:2-methylfumaryl-CoA isomerase
MQGPLTGLTIVEVSAFIAVPLGGMTLAQLGAEVIRIDPIGGNIDFTRWPLAPSGTSLYWTALNKAKRSVTLALNTAEGQAIASDLIAKAGILLTNLPAKGWMGYEALRQKRPDLIMMTLTGNPDGSSAVDYTVNCASGFPIVTGEDERPVNHVLPAWDVIAGLYCATGILTADRLRHATGEGQEITLSLADAMLATVGNLGYIADVQVNGRSRGPLGNHLYGAYGSTFRTSDGRFVMVVAISDRQWAALGKATGLAAKLAMVGDLLDLDMSDEGDRFKARHGIDAVLAPWFEVRTLREIRTAFENSGVLWGPYQDFEQLVRDDPRCSAANPLFAEIEQAGVGRVLAPRVPLRFADRLADPASAPVLGNDTVSILQEKLGQSADDLAKLVANKTISAF